MQLEPEYTTYIATSIGARHTGNVYVSSERNIIIFRVRKALAFVPPEYMGMICVRSHAL